jgi:hypothetical protein
MDGSSRYWSFGAAEDDAAEEAGAEEEETGDSTSGEQSPPSFNDVVTPATLLIPTANSPDRADSNRLHYCECAPAGSERVQG